MCELRGLLARIEQRLEATGQSATAASDAAGLSKDAIRNLRRRLDEEDPNYQSGETGVNTTTLYALAPVLGVSVPWLLEGDRADPRPTAYRVTLPDGRRVLVEPEAVTPLFAQEPTERR